MRRQSQTATNPPEPARSSSGTSRWLLVAVALCGALAGGSIVEAVAAMASPASTPVFPGHLVAEPLALAGAICGGLLALVLAGKDQPTVDNHPQDISGLIAPAEITPGEPMMWHPTPQMLPSTQSPALPEASRARPTRQALRIHRSLRQRRHSHHVIRTAISRPPAQH
ncbi:MAG TPA: hypothetical protein VFU63_05225 [Ktedonobacterales bacterium]|nr:hypothetical protein [Ktedonobacterales bacterium]